MGEGAPYARGCRHVRVCDVIQTVPERLHNVSKQEELCVFGGEITGGEKKAKLKDGEIKDFDIEAIIQISGNNPGNYI